MVIWGCVSLGQILWLHKPLQCGNVYCLFYFHPFLSIILFCFSYRGMSNTKGFCFWESHECRSSTNPISLVVLNQVFLLSNSWKLFVVCKDFTATSKVSPSWKWEHHDVDMSTKNFFYAACSRFFWLLGRGGLNESIKKGKFVTKIFFSDNAEWSFEKLISAADVKANKNNKNHKIGAVNVGPCSLLFCKP